MHKMMSHVVPHENPKTGVWPRCVAAATKVKSIMVNQNEEKYAYENFYSKITDYKKEKKVRGNVSCMQYHQLKIKAR